MPMIANIEKKNNESLKAPHYFGCLRPFVIE